MEGRKSFVTGGKIEKFKAHWEFITSKSLWCIWRNTLRLISLKCLITQVLDYVYFHYVKKIRIF